MYSTLRLAFSLGIVLIHIPSTSASAEGTSAAASFTTATASRPSTFAPFSPRAIKEEGIDDFPAQVFTLIETDICNTDAILQALYARDVDAIVHLAARAGVRPDRGTL